MRLFEEQNIRLSEKINQLDGNRLELLKIIEELENAQKQNPNDISTFSVLGNTGTEKLEIKSENDFE